VGEGPPVNIRLSADRVALRSPLPDWVKAEIRQRGLVTGNGEAVSFCGLMARGDEVHVFLPRGTTLAEDGERVISLASLLTGCIERYARGGTSTKETGERGEEGMVGNDRLAVIRELLEDYRLNGGYSTVSQYRTLNSGKTDWRRTINRVTPFPDRRGIPVYPDLHGTRNRYAADSVVARIHASVIARLDRMFGWWVTGRPNGRVASGLSETAGLLALPDYCLAMLRLERASVFSDRNLRLLTNLIIYLSGGVGDAVSPVVIGLRDFHWAWEHMLGEVLANRSDAAREFPVPVYYSSGGQRNIVPAKGMRTDIILEQKSESYAVVVDAKYYSASSAGDAPGWPDLVKQFFYAKALGIVRPDWRIGSVFVFPNVAGPLEAARVENRDGSRCFDIEFPSVRCIYADPVEVMRYYLSRQYCNNLTDAVMLAAS